jgi:small subunit ribosomal protein S3
MLFSFFNKLFNILGPKFNIKGIKLQFKGRFSNAKRTKVRLIKYGKIPLQSLNVPVLYGDRHVLTIYGVCSVRFWLYL